MFAFTSKNHYLFQKLIIIALVHTQYLKFTSKIEGDIVLLFIDHPTKAAVNLNFYFIFYKNSYSKVSNRRGVWNSGGGWKKYPKLIVGGGGGGWNSRGVGRLEKTENFNSRRGLLNCFFLSFSNHDNYGTKNICIYSKSKMKTKNKIQNILR